MPIFNLIFYDSTNIFFSLKHQINVKIFIELLNPRTLKNSVVIFKTLNTFTASLTSAASAASMASATSKALFHQKTSWSWWFHPPWHQNYKKLVPFCGLDHKKSWFLVVSGNLDVRGCWGQAMLLFWKNIDKTQMSSSPKCAATFFWTWKSFLGGHLGLQSMSYRVETPCR